MTVKQRQQGNFIQADFFDNSGGLNITDSPFVVHSNQATSGYNYDYTSTGGLRKRNGHTKLNGAADAKLRTLGFALHNTSAGVKTLLRAAGTALQIVNTADGTTTNVTEDTVDAGSAPFSTNQPVVSSQFNTPLINSTWFAGGGQSSGTIIGTNGTKYTANGSAAPTGSLGLSTTTSGGALPDTTKFWYAVSLHKLSTGSESNAALDTAVTTGSSGSSINTVTIDLTGLTSLDTTKYNQIFIYRSSVSGVSGFTVGDLAGIASSTATSFIDTGAVQGSAQLVPRPFNTLLDNSTLPAGTYKCLTVFKRRLVTAQDSTLYFSDVNKSEAWPSNNNITIPSGGPITALGIISFSTPTTTATDEFLCVFKERELWVVTGNDSTDFALLFVDYVGCIAQPLLVLANGFLTWIDYRGVYLWDGSNKPVYSSRPIEYDFGPDGDIDKGNLIYGNGSFYRKQNQVVWHLSSNTIGAQNLVLKMDLRLTLPNMNTALSGRTLEGVFIKDSLSYPIYACLATLPTFDEVFYGGDISGNTFKLFFNINSDNNLGIAFKYRTKSEDFDNIGTTKRFHKIIVYCRDSTLKDLTLNYWVGYKTDPNNEASQALPVTNQVTNAVWDQSTWDACYWDTNLVTYSPVVFNLGNASIGVEGDALTLEFAQLDANSPVIIAGYSVLYTLAGVRK